jgi:hypothetical protein
MPRFTGVGPRIKARLLDLGYRQATNGAPDVARFCLDHRYDRAIFHEWSSDRSTPTKALARLAQDLQTTESYLIFGIEAPAPVAATAASGSARRADRTLPAGKTPKPRPRRVLPIRGGSAHTPPPPADPEALLNTSYQTLENHRQWLRAA